MYYTITANSEEEEKNIWILSLSLSLYKYLHISPAVPDGAGLCERRAWEKRGRVFPLLPALTCGALMPRQV